MRTNDDDLDQLAPAATTGQEGVCGLRVAPLRPRWRSVPRSFSTDSGVPKAVPGRPRTPEALLRAHYINHSPRQHSKCGIDQYTLESTTVIRPTLRKCPYGAIRAHTIVSLVYMHGSFGRPTDRAGPFTNTALFTNRSFLEI